MRRLGRWAAVLAIPLLALPAYALGSDDSTPDEQSINVLQQKIVTAGPREQCFLYAELIHEMTEVSIQQYNAGNDKKANA
ncbi:MAG TPA: hypothetical protein VGR64_06330, partial [Terracidiphilus sp.]|nr:hypothetical protein [Terracidiphilus sp.]